MSQRRSYQRISIQREHCRCAAVFQLDRAKRRARQFLPIKHDACMEASAFDLHRCRGEHGKDACLDAKSAIHPEMAIRRNSRI